MAVGCNGPLAGSIGGGQAEKKMVDAARAALQAGRYQPWRQTLTHHAGAPEASGMICGGEQTVVVGFWQPGQDLPAPDQAWSIDGEGWAYCHHPAEKITVCLIGGGHVSLALSQLLAWLDFAVVVFEERPGISTFIDNDAAGEKILLPYENLADWLAEHLPVSEQVFVAIMTHTHERDALVLHQLSGMTFGYLGLIGSQHKIRQLLHGQAPPDFFHAPMGRSAGLKLSSHTPKEIALTIAAEMLAVRQQR